MSRIIKVSVRVISLSLRLRLITLTSTLIILDITKTSSNNCLVYVSVLKLTNRFHVAVHLSFNRSQMTSKCGKSKKVAHEAIAECVTVCHCDLLKDRCTATWNLSVLYNKELNFVRIKAALFHVRRAKVGRSPF